jgi:hypothetical protein
VAGESGRGEWQGRVAGRLAGERAAEPRFARALTVRTLAW